jgi:hypothetical protein
MSDPARPTEEMAEPGLLTGQSSREGRMLTASRSERSKESRDRKPSTLATSSAMIRRRCCSSATARSDLHRDQPMQRRCAARLTSASVGSSEAWTFRKPPTRATKSRRLLSGRDRLEHACIPLKRDLHL